MINSTAFDYVNVLTKAADASWKRESIITNNISNRIIKRKNELYQHHKKRSNQMNSSLFFAVSLIE